MNLFYIQSQRTEYMQICDRKLQVFSIEDILTTFENIKCPLQ